MNSFNILNEFIDSAKRNNLKPTYDELNKHIEYYIKNNKNYKIIKKQHWIIRVGDGINFKNSKKSIWGINRGSNNNVKSTVQKKLNTYTNEELGWSGEQKWDIQIHYKNLYETEEQNISFTVHNPRSIIDYNTHFMDIEENLQEHYNNYKKYAKPKIF